jgi:hypothetical protein
MFVELKGDFTPDDLEHEFRYVIEFIKNAGVDLVVDPKIRFQAFENGRETHSENCPYIPAGLVVARLTESSGSRTSTTRFGIPVVALQEQWQRDAALKRLTKVWEAAFNVFGCERSVNEFLTTPLEGTGVPQALAVDSEFGADIVLTILARMAPFAADQK